MAISRSEADSMSALQITILEQAEDPRSLGNPRLRNMGVLEVRRLLRKEMITDAVTLAKWKAYDDEWRERERTYATASYRSFERGERGGRF